MEVAMFMLGLILFLSQFSLMWFIWLHILHVPRAVIGFLLMHRLPRTHDIIADVDIPEKPNGEHYSLDGV